MKNSLLFILALVLLAGCHQPTEFPVFEQAKPANEFAQGFINNLFNREPDSCFAKILPDSLTDNAKRYINDACRALNGTAPRKCRVVAERVTQGPQPIFTLHGTARKDSTTYYYFQYDYEIGATNLLTEISIIKTDGRMYVAGFNAKFLPASLEVLTAFTFRDKSLYQYLFLLVAVLVPLFIITSFFVMLRIKMPAKTKVKWSLIILWLSLPYFKMTWGSGATDFQLVHFSLTNMSIWKPGPVLYWIISFHFPLGAILFWRRRKRLMEPPDDIHSYYPVQEATEGQPVADAGGNNGEHTV